MTRLAVRFPKTDTSKKALLANGNIKLSFFLRIDILSQIFDSVHIIFPEFYTGKGLGSIVVRICKIGLPKFLVLFEVNEVR